MLWGGRNTANKYHWHVWGMLTVSQPHWVCPLSQCVCFPSLYCSGSMLLCRELSEAGPGLGALPRSKPLRFRFSGTPQRWRLGWTCVLCPSQVRAAQVMRCFASMVTAQFSGCTTGTPSQADIDRPEPQEVLVSKEAWLQFCR